ncbi:MAG TPA: hypothetical protein VGH74_04180, partial [Planctomycetaceae bacterium]
MIEGDDQLGTDGPSLLVGSAGSGGLIRPITILPGATIGVIAVLHPLAIAHLTGLTRRVLSRRSAGADQVRAIGKTKQIILLS